MLASEIIRRVKEIQVRTGRPVADVLAGEYVSVFRGSGVEFEEGHSADGLLRLGGSYKLLDLWGADIKPGLFVDLFRGRTAFVVGLEFGWDF